MLKLLNLCLKAEILSKIEKKLSSFVEKVESLLHQLGLEKAKVKLELFNERIGKFGTEKNPITIPSECWIWLKPIQNAISGGERKQSDAFN